MIRSLLIHPWKPLARLAGGVCLLAAAGTLSAQEANKAAPAPAQPRAPVNAAPDGAHTYLARQMPMPARKFYEGVWGIDTLKVKYTESGELIRFSYNVLDPAKAAALNDAKSAPSLIDPQAGVKLVVPQMEKIGHLRQSSAPIAGRQYWMAFSNSGRRVRPGHRVDIEIGNFHARGLVVE